MASREKTCAYFIELILKRGGRWRNKQIELSMLHDYGVVFQNNTIAKYLSFFINEGRASSAPVHLESGKTCDEYWWIEKENKAAHEIIDDQLATQHLDAAATYPEGHPQRAAIMQEYYELTARKVKAA
jgi:hypothetical protein